jgi:hypothetical protein
MELQNTISMNIGYHNKQVEEIKEYFELANRTKRK